MATDLRTASGGRIYRAQPLAFTFDGRRLAGLVGDTLASALLANGIHLVARSFKYHRPRGILSAGAEEPNALVTIDRGGGRTTPNLPATQVELYDGLVASSQNRWPSLALDAGAVNSLAAPMLAAGFYYKTFMGPRRLGSTRAWTRVYEPLIRRAAGLGRAPVNADPDRYASRYAHCDVLVIGAGPAGLAAALAAAGTGARVILCDEQAEPGGSLLAEDTALIDGRPAAHWLKAALDELRGQERVRILPRTQAFGIYAQGFVGLAERLSDHLESPRDGQARERLWHVRAREIVIAAGAIERPLVFPGNDRPGIMLADAARTYVNRYGVRPGTRAVVATATDSAYLAALALKAAGVEVAAVADLRPEVSGPAPTAARAAGIEVLSSHVIARTTGRLRVNAVGLARIGDDGSLKGSRAIACDLVLMSGGWTPSVHLVSQARVPLIWSKEALAFVPGPGIGHVHVAGSAAGRFGLEAVLADGTATGAAAGEAATGRRATPRRHTATEPAMSWSGMLGACPSDGRSGPAFVDFQNDVTTKDLAIAVQEGFRSIEHVKRYTTIGMATEQGKTSSLNALAIVAELTGRPIEQVGHTTFRQPYTPVSFGAIAGYHRGELFDPIRSTPIDPWARARGAVFEPVGLWQRARYFPRPGEDMAAAVARECQTVRQAVGLFDASTLGKIEVVGRDAAEFLERLYVNAVHRLESGRCRYGLMLSEAGFILDDGIIARLAADHFHVTTTSSGAARVLHLMEDYLQTEFTDLEVWLTSVTEQWSVIAVQGPRSRDVIALLVEGIDLAPGAFPHMAVRQGRICGVETRLMRVSFTGEMGFEVNVPSGYGLAVWEALAAEAARHGGAPYGTEAMHVLRAEKGHIIIGQDTDGTVTPDDVGLTGLIGKGKRNFIGRRSLAMPDLLKPDRKQLVGLLTRDAATLLDVGAQVTSAPYPPLGTGALGHVTSSYRSEALGRPIALALVAGGRARIGTTLHVPMGERSLEVEVVRPVFVDPEGKRVHG